MLFFTYFILLGVTILKENNKNPIDFVIYWVNGNDSEWLKDKNKYDLNKGQDGSSNRYRDWDNLQFWFRGVEKYAPWVNKIFFITYGHLPVWLNTNHPKLVIVKHEEYIPSEYLPTFSANPIELNLHRIKGLSENFVVFNDDFFIIKKTNPYDFFEDGIPKDIFMEYPVMCGGNNRIFSNMLVNNFNLLGKYFNRDEYKKKLVAKILSPKYGFYLFYNLILYLLPYPRFFGVLTPHFARPYLKSSFEELWELEEEYLKEVCMNKFRDINDVNIYIFRNWNIMKGNFKPENIFKFGKAYFLNNNNTKVYHAIEHQKYKLVCINDECNEKDFQIIKENINKSFEKIMPKKCSFEK